VETVVKHLKSKRTLSAKELPAIDFLGKFCTSEHHQDIRHMWVEKLLDVECMDLFKSWVNIESHVVIILKSVCQHKNLCRR
jgi:hypothetical protein